MRKLNLLFTMLLSIITTTIFAATPLSGAKTFETNILKLDCSGFTVSGTGTTEMSAGASPNNWTAATGSQWTSTNCYPANITTGVPHIKQAVQFGSSEGTTTAAATPTLDLSSITGKSTKMRIILTAGSNKTGAMAVKLDGTTIGTINASTSAPGGTAFGGDYYIFEYDLTVAGTQTSVLSFEHSKSEAAGFLYVKEISIYREPISLLKLNCQLFSGNSISLISSAAYPNNWTASLGSNPASTTYCYAQNAVNTSYGSGVRMGAGTTVNSGSFTTNNYDLASSQTYKNKFYIELLVISTSTVGKLDMKVDGGSSQWTYNPASDNGSGGAVAVNTWIPYEGEITGGGSTSNITFYQTRSSGTGSIYIRNLRIYREYPGAPTSVVATAGNGKASVAFTAPSVTGGSALTGFTVTSSPVGSTATGASSPLVVSGLANGTAYTFTVTATNSGGSGAASAASNSVIPHATNNILAVSSAADISTLTLTPVSDLVVNNDAVLTINQTTTINSLTVAAGGMVTNTSTLTTPTLTLNSDATNGTGTYINEGTSNVTTLIANQYLGTTRNWYVSSPVVSTSSSSTNIARYYEYIEAGDNNTTGQPTGSTAYWKGYNPGHTMVAGKGYIALPSAIGGNVTFSGTMNTGNVSILLSKAGTGYNLIGNPYPSHLTWTKTFVDSKAAQIEPTIWYRTNNGSVNSGIGAAWSFITYNASTDESTPALAPKGIIPPMQAFWVKAVAAGTLVLNTDLAKSHQTSNPLKAPAVKNTERQRVRLQVSNGTRTDETLLLFDANASDGYDVFDSPKFAESNSEVQIYTSVGNEKLVMNGMKNMPLNQEIALGFVPGSATSFSIKANEISNLPADVKVILKDHVTKAETDLTDGLTMYQFAPEVTSNDRFSLIFRTPGVATTIGNSTKLNVQVFINAANQITIIAPEKSNYAIYNAMGQLIENGILSYKLNTTNCKLNTGVYVVKVGNNSTRVIIK